MITLMSELCKMGALVRPFFNTCFKFSITFCVHFKDFPGPVCHGITDTSTPHVSVQSTEAESDELVGMYVDEKSFIEFYALKHAFCSK